jgi:predicted methyltransferase
MHVTRLRLLSAALSLALPVAAFAQSTAGAAPPNFPTLPPPDIVLDGKTAPEATPAATPAAQGDAPATSAALAHALAGDWRSEANRARDAYRHPAQTLEFFGVRDDQTVLEIWPGGGWYAEVLAPMLRERGHYVGVLPKAEPTAEGGVSGTQRNNDRLRAKFAARPDLFDKAELREAVTASPVLGPDGSADVVLTFRNAHNWVADGNEQAMFRAFFAVLKPGGTLGVVDHRAAPDQPPADMKTSGYLPEAYVIALAEGAGFKLAGKSEVNANPRDTKDYAKGVWTLPPTYTLGDVDRAKYAAIGESDRMTLKFVKPD